MGLDELAAAVAGRAGWTAGDRTATYRPLPERWRADVRALTAPGRAFDRFNIAIVDPRGHARFTKMATSAGEAIRVAEGQVHAQQPPATP